MIRKTAIENLIHCCIVLANYRAVVILPTRINLQDFRKEFNCVIDSIPSFLTSGISHNATRRIKWNTNIVDFTSTGNSLKGQTFSAIYVSKLLSENKTTEISEALLVYRLYSNSFPVVYFN
jgi:hypothetical protein